MLHHLNNSSINRCVCISLFNIKKQVQKVIKEKHSKLVKQHHNYSIKCQYYIL